MTSTTSKIGGDWTIQSAVESCTRAGTSIKCSSVLSRPNSYLLLLFIYSVYIINYDD